ncbi:TonB family protein [Marinobacter confluentis]|uniref:TonB family protein n=1 Tax=Marinobacter confluentis TaxID=1697557 RepID=A0A4Z1BU84_9GAMM|nr:TonB family protein [Marinobacter confluentis]TGN41019.1 TonB family protein [Marinobacter confluentis]
MLQYGKDTGLPETYRITLAVSVALLAHTLLMATFTIDLPKHSYNPVTVSVQLTPRGSRASAKQPPASTAPAVVAEPFTIEEMPPSEPTRALQVTSTPQPRKAPEPQPEASPEHNPVPDRPNRQESLPQPAQNSARATLPSAPSKAGRQTGKPIESEHEITLQSEAPSEESSYISLLAQTIGERATIRKLEDVKKGQTLSVELELDLMSNGALVAADISRSSGNDGLDQRVYRAALEASPYPEPPSSASRQRPFRVEVRYTF